MSDKLITAMEILDDPRELKRRAKRLHRASVWLRRGQRFCTWLGLDIPAWLERRAASVREETQFLKNLHGAGYGR